MNKFLLLVLLTFASKFSFSQLVSGAIVDDNRKLLTAYDFKIKGNYTGVKYFKLAVNIDGKVTSVKEEIKPDSFVSTPASILAHAELKKLEFEKGTSFPKFHHVLVKVNYVKGK